MSSAAIVLAAGASRRLGRPKQLLRVGGETLLDRAIRLATEAGAAPVVVVLGANCEAIRTTASLSNAIVIRNDRWQDGIASSIQAGLDTLLRTAPESEGVALLVCDQPALTADHLRALTHAFVSAGCAAIVSSRYAGVLGVPAVFPRSTFGALQRLEGDQGARALLANPPCELIPMEFPGGEVDIDWPTDLAQLE